jgi:phosphatidylglycerol:prolipoprotein diacylglycerol transferase
MVENPVAFSIGPLTIRWYGIIIMLGVLAGAFLAANLARRKKENPDHLWNMVPFVVFTAIFGARLYWVFLEWQAGTLDGWREAINIRGGGISIHGAIVFGIIAIIVYTRLNHLRFFRWIDIIAPAMALGQAIGRWGNFTNQEAFGGPTSLPWGIYIKPDRRPPEYANFTHFHPTFLYESIWDLITCAVLVRLCLRIDRNRRLRDGDTLWVYLIFYAIGRFAIESLRTDSLMLGPFKAAHVASALALIAGIAGLAWRHIGWQGDEPADDATQPAAATDTAETAAAGPTTTPGADSNPALGETMRGTTSGSEPSAHGT